MRHFLARGTVCCLSFALLWSTVGLVANGGPHPSTRTGKSSGGCVCLPNARQFGYFKTIWRAWPGEHRPDKTFPQVIGGETIPTPPGKPLSQSTREYMTPRRVGPPSAPVGIPAMESDLFPKQSILDAVPKEPAPLLETDSKVHFPPILPGLGSSEEETDSTEKEPLGITPFQKVPMKGMLPSTNDGSSTEGRYPVHAPEVRPEPYPVARTQPSQTHGQPILVPEPRISEPNRAVFPTPNQVVLADLAVDQEPSAVGANVQNEIESIASDSHQVVHNTQTTPSLSTIHPEPTPKPKLDLNKTESRLNPYRPGLNGFCPVELLETQHWKEGDPRYAVVYRQRAYFLLGPDQKKKFQSNPERYALALDGLDPVLAIDENRHASGSIDYCVDYDGRLYLFSSGFTLARFRQNPSYYAKQIQ